LATLAAGGLTIADGQDNKLYAIEVLASDLVAGDYFVNVNRRLAQPVLIDLEMFEAGPRAASVDSLTGLATDRAFRGALQGELRRAKRYGLTVPVVLFDLDDFARVNREFGQLVGDRLLREVGILLHNKIRDIDLAARPGEYEMALILPETDRNGALLVAERFRWEVESHFARREAGGRPDGLTISAGVACYPEDARAPEALLDRAAQALYRAKAQGKNSVQAFEPERRRFLRFDLDPTRVEVEVLAPRDLGRAVPRNLCRSGIVFGSPEPLEVG
jgi:diguanylate cyclase (GGDEF)-like protein